MKTILIVDDHIIFRLGLRFTIDRWEEFKVVGEASDGAEALQLFKQLQPDIVLMDIAMPCMDGIEAVREIMSQSPKTDVVMLTISESENDLFRALMLGASGYILKGVKPDELRNMLTDVSNGEAALSPRMAARVIKEFKQGKDAVDSSLHSPGMLTPREIDVLELVAAGLSNSEVACQLVISENTVKKHIHSILEKLQLNNRVEAAVYAVREGMIRD